LAARMCCSKGSQPETLSRRGKPGGQLPQSGSRGWLTKRYPSPDQVALERIR